MKYNRSKVLILLLSFTTFGCTSFPKYEQILVHDTIFVINVDGDGYIHIDTTSGIYVSDDDPNRKIVFRKNHTGEMVAEVYYPPLYGNSKYYRLCGVSLESPEKGKEFSVPFDNGMGFGFINFVILEETSKEMRIKIMPLSETDAPKYITLKHHP